MMASPNQGIDVASALLRSCGGCGGFLRYKGVDHRLDDSDARVEMLTEIGKILEKAIGR